MKNGHKYGCFNVCKIYVVFFYLGIRCDLKRARITINRARANALIKTGKISSCTSPKGSVLGSSLDYILARFLISIRLINY